MERPDCAWSLWREQDVSIAEVEPVLQHHCTGCAVSDHDIGRRRKRNDDVEYNMFLEMLKKC